MAADTESNQPRPVSAVARQLEALGIKGGEVLLVHTSYRAVRPVEGGPGGLIDALQQALGATGTLVMPSYVGNDDALFEAGATPADASLGIVANTFWRLPGVLRSEHPFAFAGRGPKAAAVTRDDPVAFPPHGIKSPVGRVFELHGRVLLLGVGHDANTTIHLAELLAGVPYRQRKHCTMLEDGVPTLIDYQENDHCCEHCCEHFTLADEWLRRERLQAEGLVGCAHARLATAQDIVSVVAARLREDPMTFLHPRGSGCAECDDAWSSVQSVP